MLFTYDTDIALAALAALVNTGRAQEQLPDVAALDAFVDEWRWTGVRRHDATELRQVLTMRERLGRLWGADEQLAVEVINSVLHDAGAVPQLVRHDEYDYHLHATSADAPLATRMGVEAAMAMVDVVRAKELGRLRWCTADDCDNVMVDLSKNRSRRYCDGGCGNRANVAAYRARQAAGTS